MGHAAIEKDAVLEGGGFQVPDSWRDKDVLAASFGINLLALMLPIVVLQVYDRIIPHQAMDTFLVLILAMGGAVLLEGMLRVLRSVLLARGGTRFEHRQSLDAIRHVLHSDTQDYDANPRGTYLDRMQALEELHQFYSGQSMLLLMDFPFVVLFLALVWIIAGSLMLIPLVLLALFAIGAFVLGNHLHKALQERNRTDTNRQNFLMETLGGIHTVKSMAMEALMLRRYERLQKTSAESIYELARINSVVQGFGTTFSQVAMVTFVGLGSLQVLDGGLTIGALAAGMMLSGRVLQPGLKAMGLWTQFQGVRLSMDRVEQLYELKPEISGDYRNPDHFEGHIKIENVSFKYPGQDKWLLRNASLEIPPGTSIGITGHNGAGKSTLISLLTGFIHPNEGRILVDGVDLRAYDQEYLRSQIGYVPQEGILYEGSILENMTLFREGTALKHATELARMLGLDEVIGRMPDGLETKVGGGAVDTLSEGIRQKIIIVRSLVGHPKLLLFDDANASFDIKNDQRFMEVIKEYKKGKTLVVVSHRPSFLKICDRQYKVSNGSLVNITPKRLKVVFNKAKPGHD